MAEGGRINDCNMILTCDDDFDIFGLLRGAVQNYAIGEISLAFIIFQSRFLTLSSFIFESTKMAAIFFPKTCDMNLFHPPANKWNYSFCHKSNFLKIDQLRKGN